MSQKVIDFLSSVGIMVFGVGLLFFSSVTLTSNPVHNFVSNLPTSNVRPFAEVGGDVAAVLPSSRPAIPLLRTSTEYNLPVTAESAAVVDDQTNVILFKKNASEIRSLASITKLMSALVLTDLPLSWSSSTIVTEEDSDPFSHHFVTGETYKIEDLWKVALIGSSNSAVRSLVRATGLTEQEFVEKMNQKAEALGLNSLRFVEPTGLDSRNMGNAVDVLKLLKAALKNDRITEALSMPEYYFVEGKKRKHVWTTNWLLTNWIPNSFDKDVLSGKTGFIDQSGYNFVGRIPGQNNHVLRVVILGAATNEARFAEARDMSEWVFANHVWPDEAEYALTFANR